MAVVDAFETAPCRRSGDRRTLKLAGYLIALDDFTIKDPGAALADFADILKVDLRQTTPEEAAAIVKQYGPWKCRLLAENVETREEFVATKAAGFIYFQGYFFRR
jgi:c-di-GMP phosphodiesterase